MHAYMSIPLRLASLAYSSFCEKEGAVKFGMRAMEAQLLESGEYAVDIELIRSLVESPEEHWSWCKRVRK